MSTYQDQLNAGFSKVCEICKVCIESLKYVPRVLHTSLLLWGHFHAPKHDAAQNGNWLLYLSVICPLEWSLVIQRSQGSQTFCHQSEGLATRDYNKCDCILKNKTNMRHRYYGWELQVYIRRSKLVNSPKMKILSLFSHPHVISNLIYFLSSVEHKNIFSKECIGRSFACNGDQTFKLQNEFKSMMNVS